MNTRDAIRYLRPFIWRYRSGFFSGLACLVMKDAIAVCGPLVLGRGIDALKAGADARSVAGFALLLLAVSAAKGIFQFGMRIILIGVSRDIEFDLRNDLFRHVISLSPDYFARWARASCTVSKRD